MDGFKQTLGRAVGQIVPLLSPDVKKDTVRRIYLGILNRQEIFEEVARAKDTDELVRIMERHDTITADHLRRVGELSYQVADAYGADRKIARDAGRAHDVGKLFVGEKLHALDLNEADREYLKHGHALAGVAVCNFRRLRGNPLPPEVEEGMKFHHTSRTGESYPLSVVVYTPTAPTVQLADIRDAMEFRGGYQRKFSHDETAAALLRKGHAEKAVEKVLT